MSFWESFWDIIWWFLWIFAFIAYLFTLFAVIGDLFRDHRLNGWWKAVWVLFLIFVPFLTVLVYLIARGSGMAEHSREASENARAAADAYIQQVAGSGVSPSDEISKAQSLLDSGAITAEEFQSIKRKVLS
ncbi:SHOCT domain-containing protein [Leucobacter luti]|uniref:Phospholipase D-like protein n=1 Tax=Leucobacter luti TaxID=340320 RepID=A0A4Q7TKJ5_9MICO|nr:SHOCT domain-containing protein [Leucobacter luti]MBL3700176.1 SHOCT domain-containing protein [Leucobacter luti]RZT61101.1 phospholipase D-like protein [Leucobacter luti]